MGVAEEVALREDMIWVKKRIRELLAFKNAYQRIQEIADDGCSIVGDDCREILKQELAKEYWDKKGLGRPFRVPVNCKKNGCFMANEGWLVFWDDEVEKYKVNCKKCRESFWL